MSSLSNTTRRRYAAPCYAAGCDATVSIYVYSTVTAAKSDPDGAFLIQRAKALLCPSCLNREKNRERGTLSIVTEASRDGAARKMARDGVSLNIWDASRLYYAAGIGRGYCESGNTSNPPDTSNPPAAPVKPAAPDTPLSHAERIDPSKVPPVGDWTGKLTIPTFAQDTVLSERIAYTVAEGIDPMAAAVAESTLALCEDMPAERVVKILSPSIKAGAILSSKIRKIRTDTYAAIPAPDPDGIGNPPLIMLISVTVTEDTQPA